MTIRITDQAVILTLCTTKLYRLPHVHRSQYDKACIMFAWRRTVQLSQVMVTHNVQVGCRRRASILSY